MGRHGRQAGVLAQQIAQVIPTAVVAGRDGELSVAYNELSATLIQAVKELSEEVAELRARSPRDRRVRLAF